MSNGDQFNAEIEALAKGKYIEPSIYTPKKRKNAYFEIYRDKQNEAASAAFKEETWTNGLFDFTFMLTIFLESFSFLAAAMLKNSLPFDYLTVGHQMGANIEYEIQQAKKRKTIEYKPVYDSTSFKCALFF